MIVIRFFVCAYSQNILPAYTSYMHTRCEVSMIKPLARGTAHRQQQQQWQHQ